MSLWIVKMVDKKGQTLYDWPRFLVVMPGQPPVQQEHGSAFLESIYDKVRRSHDYNSYETVSEHTLDAEIVELNHEGCSLSI